MGILGSADCTPGSYNNEGQPMERASPASSATRPHRVLRYLERWRSSGDFEGLEFR